MRYFLPIALIFFCTEVYGQFTLSDQSQISVITCAPYQGELYSAFGHSAIRVYDPVHQIDYAYNYGVFDFDQPNFYLNFTRGHLLYKLAVQHYPRFRDIYLYYGRWVHEQVINLDQSQKQRLFDYLQWNALPENQNYLYDYFYNNCATKIRDVFKEALKDEISFDGSYITTNYSIRDLTDIYLKAQPWGDLGIDICLGLPMDKKATAHEYMFLPDYIESSFNHAVLKKGDRVVPVVKETIVLTPENPEVISNFFPHPWVIFGGFLLAVIGFTWKDFKQKKLSGWLDFILLFITGTIGCLLFILWVATDHKAAANNFNLLWAFPPNLIIAFILFGKLKGFLKKYFAGLTVLTVLLILLWPLLPQDLNPFLLPLVIALGLRYAVNYWFRHKEITYEAVG